MFLILYAFTFYLVSYAQGTADDPPTDGPSETTITDTVKPTINVTIELSSFCRTCPYNICPHPLVPDRDEIYAVSCWTEGDFVGDTDLWLKTSEDCYLPEYDIIQHEGDLSAELESCGHVPLKITQQPATIRYLSECKWGYSTGDETIEYYDRDTDVTLTCWAEGASVMDDIYWYQTLDLCWVSGSGLWRTPDRDKLDWCGPGFGPRLNESDVPDDPNDTERGPVRRWLQPEQIGEEYAGCYTCPSNITSEACHLKTVYEFNQTVVSQCVASGEPLSTHWMLTTDWCYVDSDDFWVPPYDYYRYPNCERFYPEEEEGEEEDTS